MGVLHSSVFTPPSVVRMEFGGFLLCAYAFLLPVQIPVGSGRLAPADICLFIYLLLFFHRVRHVRCGWSAWHVALIGAFGMGLLVSLLRFGSISSYALLTKTGGLFVLLLTYAVLLDYCAERDGSAALVASFVVGVSLQALLAIAAYVLQVAGVLHTELINPGGARVSGLLVDPNAFGGIVEVALVLILWTARSPRPAWPFGHGQTTAAIILLLALALTFSRSAWLALLFVLTVAFILRGVKGVASFRGRLLVALAAGICLVLITKPTLLSLATRPDQVEGRVQILAEAEREFVSSPLVGIGLGNHVLAHGVIIHNTMAWLAAETGVIGLGIFLGFLWWYVHRLWLRFCQNELDSDLAFATMLGILSVLGLSLGIEAMYQRYWWLLFAVAGGLFARGRAGEPDPPALVRHDMI